MRALHSRVVTFGALIIFAPSDVAKAAEVKVLSAVGMRQVMLELRPRFERASGHGLKIEFDSAGVIVKRLDGGEAVDAVIVPESAMERFVAAKKVGSVVNLASSVVGVAVREGTPRPDISSPQAFKRTMLRAKTIACPDPSLGGSSGVHIATVFERLGIAAAVKPRLVFASAPGKATAMPGHLVANGTAEIALHQMQELMAVPGIEIVGPLPGHLQARFTFSVAVTAAAKEPSAAKALVEFLRTPETKAVIKTKGMEASTR